MLNSFRPKCACESSSVVNDGQFSFQWKCPTSAFSNISEEILERFAGMPSLRLRTDGNRSFTRCSVGRSGDAVSMDTDSQRIDSVLGLHAVAVQPHPAHLMAEEQLLSSNSPGMRSSRSS